MSLVQPTHTYTYQDYVKWDDDQRWELIDGVAYNMNAPLITHQRLVIRLSGFFDRILRGKKCEAFPAPTDVILSDYDVVQPDILVVCDPNKIKKEGIFGAPDLVIEILSPTTSRRDRWDKKALYAKYSVKEYLLVDPEGKYIEQYVLDVENQYSSGNAYADEDIIALQSLEDVQLPVADLFEKVNMANEG